MTIQKTIFLSAFLLCAMPMWAAEKTLTFTPNPVAPEYIRAFTLEKGRQVPTVYLGQVAQQGEIDLTPSNGFFDNNWSARDAYSEAETPLHDGDLNRTDYRYLEKKENGSQELGDARWHLWCPKAGKIQVSFCMEVPQKGQGQTWILKVGDEAQTLKAQVSDGKVAQPTVLTFNVKTAGKISFTLNCGETPLPDHTKIYGIRLQGSAIKEASVLRGSWIPNGIGPSFFPPKECPTTNMWVFESKITNKRWLYSPFNTNFGYFGTAFDNGRVGVGSGYNFSMWVPEKLPPIAQMPRLIATGLPKAQQITFGHEGSGIKFGNGADESCYPTGADSAVQALRVEFKDHLWSYYSYWYDENMHRWRLFASAQQYDAGNPDVSAGTVRNASSFLESAWWDSGEIARYGDMQTGVKRRGWYYGEDKNWYRAQLGYDVNCNIPKNINRNAPEKMVWGKNQWGKDFFYDERYVQYMDDYASDGWTVAYTGGLERTDSYIKGSAIAPTLSPTTKVNVPEYMKPEKLKRLFELPVDFGTVKIKALHAKSATLDYAITQTGPHSKAILYYDTKDCLTYPAKPMPTYGSDAEKEMALPERTWQMHTEQQVVKKGSNLFSLSGLQPNTTYYYRLFVQHDEGQSWDYQTGSFTTAR